MKNTFFRVFIVFYYFWFFFENVFLKIRWQHLLQSNFEVLNNELQGDLNSYVENKMFDSYGIFYEALVSKL